MPNSQPLSTRLHTGVVALALVDQKVFSGPDEHSPLVCCLARGDEITVLGEPAIGAGKRWWRIRKTGATNIAWALECDRERYYLLPIGTE